jgi:hypothetical protein
MANAPRTPRRGWVTKTITVPGNLAQACREFNEGRFFECHETLEEIWQEEQGELRDLYKGLIQVAAAFVHLTRDNYIGAERLSRTALGYLAPYRKRGAMGFDVEGVCAGLERYRERLLAEKPGAALYDRDLVPVLACDAERLATDAPSWRAWGFDRDGRALEMDIQVPDDSAPLTPGAPA